MHSLNDASSHTLPIFDKRTQPLRLKNKADSVVGRSRIAAREDGKKALCADIHFQSVPISIQDEHGIRLKLRHEEIHDAERRLGLRCIEIGLPIEWCVARRQQQGIALTQRNLESLSKP